MSLEYDAIDTAADDLLRVTQGCGGLVHDRVSELVRVILEAARDQEKATERAHGLGLDGLEDAARRVVEAWRYGPEVVEGVEFDEALRALADALEEKDE